MYYSLHSALRYKIVTQCARQGVWVQHGHRGLASSPMACFVACFVAYDFSLASREVNVTLARSQLVTSSRLKPFNCATLYRLRIELNVLIIVSWVAIGDLRRPLWPALWVAWLLRLPAL